MACEASNNFDIQKVIVASVITFGLAFSYFPQVKNSHWNGFKVFHAVFC